MTPQERLDARRQAIELLTKRLQSWGDGPLNEGDAAVDDLIRTLGRLPERPYNADPYRGVFPWLFKAAAASPAPAPTGPAELRYRHTDRFDNQGLRLFELTLWQGGKQIAGPVESLSGQPGAQFLVHPKEDRSGSQRPIPEGVYAIGEIETHATNWGPGLGRWWVSLPVLEQYRANNREAFGIHLDENHRGSPGSAGCVVFRTEQQLHTVLDWIRQYDPAYLVVDYGFGFLRQRGYKG